MSGTYTQSAGTAETCRWQASVSNEGPGVFTSQSPNPGKDPEPDYSRLDEKRLRAAREQDARQFIASGEAAARICTYADQMAAAGRFSQAAETYRLLGDNRRMKIADRLAKEASARADTCNVNKKRQSGDKNKPSSSKSPERISKAQCAEMKKQYERLRDTPDTNIRVVIDLRFKLKKACKEHF